MVFPEIVTVASSVQFSILFLVFLFYFLRKKAGDPDRKKYVWSYVVHALVTPMYLLYHKYIQKTGDMFGYNDDAIYLKHIAFDDFNLYLKLLFSSVHDQVYSNLKKESGTLVGNSEAIITKIGSVLHFFTFDEILTVSFFFSVFAFLGCWKLYKLFISLFPYQKNLLAAITLFFPSVVFWGSSISKDSICIGALGYLTYSLFQILIFKKNILRNALVTGIMIFVFLNVKIYILLSLLFSFLLYYFLFWLGSIKNMVLRISTFVGCVLILFLFRQTLFHYLEDSAMNYSLDNIAQTIVTNYDYLAKGAKAGSAYDLGTFEPTFESILKKFPVSVNIVFYRPYPWEIKNLAMLIASIESTLVLLVTLLLIFKTGIIRFFRLMFTNRLALFCMVYSIMFAFFIGISSGNFGTLMRIKIPIIPFYFFALILIRYAYLAKSKKDENLIIS